MPSSRDLPNPGIEPRSPALQADSLPCCVFFFKKISYIDFFHVPAQNSVIYIFMSLRLT